MTVSAYKKEERNIEEGRIMELRKISTNDNENGSEYIRIDIYGTKEM